MVFLPHFLKLLTQTRIDAVLAYGATLTAGPDRKRLATQLREQVIALAQR
jgi:hypothetical protein